ncbi:hypothetical protein CEXT_187971 [Caerostris extrusa]|uniref:Uncharacterized protein n=1 Tax=Caerostris extrusa TaxID=172846 RepID=A0AAV4MPJ6_CAEEX|nr:hypothetical protein CEXT_187971 [Caerostris extrusa]
MDCIKEPYLHKNPSMVTSQLLVTLPLMDSYANVTKNKNLRNSNSVPRAVAEEEKRNFYPSPCLLGDALARATLAPHDIIGRLATLLVESVHPHHATKHTTVRWRWQCSQQTIVDHRPTKNVPFRLDPTPSAQLLSSTNLVSTTFSFALRGARAPLRILQGILHSIIVFRMGVV